MKHCLHCGKALCPIGTSRKNGKAHDDWATRKYHKKCWVEIKRQPSARNSQFIENQFKDLNVLNKYINT